MGLWDITQEWNLELILKNLKQLYLMEILTTTRNNKNNKKQNKKQNNLENKPIENIKEYKYLGVTFTKQNTFKITKQYLT